MRKTRTLIITIVLVAVLGLLTVSMALAGPGNSADSLVSVSGGSSNPTGESNVVPEDRGLTLLLDQAPNQTNGLFSDADCGLCGTGQQSIAENFVLADTYTIEEIIIWSGYFPGNTAPVDDIDVIFHSNSGGLPGAAVSTETNVPATRVQTGVILFGVNEWMTTLTLANPVELVAGTWWVEIFNNTAGNADNYFWEVGNLDPVNGILNDSFAQQAPGVTWLTGNPPADNAIQIYGSQGDEPPVPGIAISKTPATQDVVTGGNANFTITVTNTGNITLTNVTVSDPLVPDCDNAIGPLAISATVSYGCEDVGVAVSYTNVATVTSTVDSVPGPTATASAEVNVVPPTSVSLSGFGGDAVAFSPVWLVAVLAVVLGLGFVIRRKLTA